MHKLDPLVDEVASALALQVVKLNPRAVHPNTQHNIQNIETFKAIFKKQTAKLIHTVLGDLDENHLIIHPKSKCIYNTIVRIYGQQDFNPIKNMLTIEKKGDGYKVFWTIPDLKHTKRQESIFSSYVQIKNT